MKKSVLIEREETDAEFKRRVLARDNITDELTPEELQIRKDYHEKPLRHSAEMGHSLYLNTDRFGAFQWSSANDRWRKDACCRGLPVEDFYPSNTEKQIKKRAIKNLCRECPVSWECISSVLQWEIPSYRYGIFGGLEGIQRRGLAKVPLKVRKKVHSLVLQGKFSSDVEFLIRNKDDKAWAESVARDILRGTKH